MILRSFIGFLCMYGVFGIDTYYMDAYCGTTLSMIDEDINTGILALDSSFTGDCNVTIETWYTANRIMFHFDEFRLQRDTGCEDTFLQVYDGVQGSTVRRFVHGLSRVCGDVAPHGDYVTGKRDVTFRFHNTFRTYNRMQVVFTSFHKGYCYSYEYECSNGRCIDDSVNCNGYNPCGDGSDCRLSTPAIVGIVVGALFAVCVFVTVGYLICRNKRRPAVQQVQPIQSRTFDVSPAAVIVHGTPPPSYGAAQPYPPPDPYHVQQDGRDTAAATHAK